MRTTATGATKGSQDDSPVGIAAASSAVPPNSSAGRTSDDQRRVYAADRHITAARPESIATTGDVSLRAKTPMMNSTARTAPALIGAVPFAGAAASGALRG